MSKISLEKGPLDPALLPRPLLNPGKSPQGTTYQASYLPIPCPKNQLPPSQHEITTAPPTPPTTPIISPQTPSTSFSSTISRPIHRIARHQILVPVPLYSHRHVSGWAIPEPGVRIWSVRGGVLILPVFLVDGAVGSGGLRGLGLGWLMRVGDVASSTTTAADMSATTIAPPSHSPTTIRRVPLATPIPTPLLLTVFAP